MMLDADCVFAVIWIYPALYWASCTRKPFSFPTLNNGGGAKLRRDFGVREETNTLGIYRIPAFHNGIELQLPETWLTQSHLHASFLHFFPLPPLLQTAYLIIIRDLFTIDKNNQ